MSLPFFLHAKKLARLWVGIAAQIRNPHSQIRNRHAEPILAVRLTAIFLILAFIVPGFFISDTYKTSAKSVSIQPSAPIAAPPEAFSIGGGNAGRGECVSILDCGFGILDFVRADGQIRIPQDSPPGLRRGGRVSRTGWSVRNRSTRATAWVSACTGGGFSVNATGGLRRR